MWAKCRVLILNLLVHIINSTFKTFNMKGIYYSRDHAVCSITATYLNDVVSILVSHKIPDYLCEPSFLTGIILLCYVLTPCSLADIHKSFSSEFLPSILVAWGISSSERWDVSFNGNVTWLLYVINITWLLYVINLTHSLP